MYQQTPPTNFQFSGFTHKSIEDNELNAQETLQTKQRAMPHRAMANREFYFEGQSPDEAHTEEGSKLSSKPTEMA